MRGLAPSVLVLMITGAHAQTPDPFIRPPPSQAPPGAPSPGVPAPGVPAPNPPVVSLDMLVRQGFEVKGMERTSDKGTDFVVIVQRSGEVRTCLMRISRDANRQLKRDSVCF